MNARFVGRSIPRVNDETMLRGSARYVADLAGAMGGVRHAAVIRSPVAHGILEGLEVGDLPPGAHLIGPEELRRWAKGGFPVLWHLAEQNQTSTPLLDDRVRYAGQPVGVVVAGSAAAAADAAETILPLIGELPAVIDPLEALAAGAPRLWDGVEGNLLAACTAGDSAEHTEAVFAAADRRLRSRLEIGRLSGAPMEGRGVLAYTEPTGKLVVHTSTQVPHGVRDVICAVLGMPQHRVRVVAPDVGGGFGLKDHLYEDEMMVIIAALVLGRPVLWTETRTESLLATSHARGEICDVEVAFDDDGTLRGLRVDAVRNAGAQCSIFSGGPLFVALGMAPGPYTWDAVRGIGRLVATNTMPTGAYRGFGQTQATLIGERAVDLVARALGRHPADVREQNMIRPESQPYTTRTHVTYDNGDYAAPLRRARELIEGRGTVASSPDDGRLRGVGYASHVQLAGVGPSFLNEILGLRIGGYESAVVRMEPDASVRLYTGVSPHGQGLETTLAQLLADELGCRRLRRGGDPQRHRHHPLLGLRDGCIPLDGPGRRLRAGGRPGTGRADPRHRRRHAGGQPRRPEPQRSAGHRGRHRRLGAAGRGGCRGTPGIPAARRSGPRTHRLVHLRPAQPHVLLRHPRLLRGGGSRVGWCRDHRLRRGAGLRHGGEPADRPRAGPRRRRAGHRCGAQRGDRLRRRRAAPHHHARRLPRAHARTCSRTSPWSTSRRPPPTHPAA